MPKTAAVIFDMDGLMFDTERLSLRAWYDAGRAFDVEIRDEHIVPYCGLPKPVFLEKVAAGLPNGTDIEAMFEHKSRFIREAMEKNGVPKKPGLDELLEALSERNIPAAVATSTSRESAMRNLEMAGVRKYFSAFVFGDEIENGKPEPDIYLAAARKLDVLPQLCMALEDSPNGAMAAIRAGMTTVFVPDLAQPTEEIAGRLYATVRSLDDVIPLLGGAGISTHSGA